MRVFTGFALFQIRDLQRDLMVTEMPQRKDENFVVQDRGGVIALACERGMDLVVSQGTVALYAL